MATKTKPKAEDTPIRLYGGPMNGMVVRPHAPALAPDWNPGGRYQLSGTEKDTGWPKAKWVPAATPEGQEPPTPVDVTGEDAAATGNALEALMSALSPFLGDVVDLGLFSGQAVDYRVLDATGKERVYPVPGDIPFPVACAFTDAYDDYLPALRQWGQIKAPGPALKTAAARTASAKRKLDEALVAILAIRKPETTFAEIHNEIGTRVLQEWYGAIALRLNLSQVRQALEEGESPKDPNRAERRRRAKSA